jgi:hypothetical protein
MARGRKSSESSLTVVPVVPGSGRPPPPRGCDQVEKRIWKQVVDSLPGHWVDQAGQVVLRRAVALAAIAERQEARLRELRAENADGGEEATKLAVAHGNTAKMIAHLLGVLRATPRTRDRSRMAGSKIAEAPTKRPWEIQGRSDESA